MSKDRSNHELNRRIVDAIQSMPESEPPADFSSRVMRGLEPKKPSVWMQFKLWLTEPRTVTMSPLRAASIMAAASVMIAVGLWYNMPDESGGVSMSPVRFVLQDSAINAKSVAVIGSFNGWKADTSVMRFDEATGEWVLETRLPPGDYEYVFLVDGNRLVPDPRAQVVRDDGFGNKNSIVFVNGDYEHAL